MEVSTFAIAPFDNITGDARDEWIGTGIIESLETEIQNARKLIQEDGDPSDQNSTDLSNPIEGNNRAINAFFSAARQQDVNLLLTGSYQRVGNQLRITARLHNLKTGTTVRAFRIDGSFDELFDIQDQLIEDVRSFVSPPHSTITNGENITPLIDANRSVTSGGLTFGETPPTDSSNSGNLGGGFVVNQRPIVHIVRTDTPPNIDGLLDDFMGQLEPFYTEYVAAGSPGTFGGFLSSRSAAVADALLSTTDERAQNSDHNLLRSTYGKLRPKGRQHVQDAMPRVAQMVDRHVSGD